MMSYLIYVRSRV